MRTIDAKMRGFGVDTFSLAFNNLISHLHHWELIQKDSNTVPSGRKDGCDVFLVFFLYTGSGANPRPVQSLVIAHTDLINADHQISGEHFNAGIPDSSPVSNPLLLPDLKKNLKYNTMCDILYMHHHGQKGKNSADFQKCLVQTVCPTGENQRCYFSKSYCQS